MKAPSVEPSPRENRPSIPKEHMADQVAFNALIKELNIKSLVSGDKAARLMLEFLPTDDILDDINRLHRADQPVSVGIVVCPDNNGNNRNEIQKRQQGKSKRKAKGGEV